MAKESGRKINGDSQSLRAYLREVAQIQRLTPDEEKELGRLIKDNQDPDAIQKLVEANLRFVISYAKRYRNRGLGFLDLINEGNMGLMEAARRFDPEKNVKFITYAVWWIRQSILQAITGQRGPYKLPQRQTQLIARLSREMASLSNKLQREPSSEEIAREMECTVEEIEELLAIPRDPVSLSTILGDDDFELLDVIEQRTLPAADKQVMKSAFEETVVEVLEKLDPKEREVVRLRYGFDGGEPKTLREIGEMLKISRERVRQIETRAKKKLSRTRLGSWLDGHLN